MSVSRIRDSDADRFSWETDRFEIVCSRRFCAAPNTPRWVETELMAASSDVIADEALLSESELMPRVLTPMSLRLTDRVSPEFAPVWNVRLPEPDSRLVPLNLVRPAMSS